MATIGCARKPSVSIFIQQIAKLNSAHTVTNLYRGTDQVQRIFQTYRIDNNLVNMEKLMQPPLPPIKKRATVYEYKNKRSLDRNILEEISKEVISR